MYYQADRTNILMARSGYKKAEKRVILLLNIVNRRILLVPMMTPERALKPFTIRMDPILAVISMNSN